MDVLETTAANEAFNTTLIPYEVPFDDVGVIISASILIAFLVVGVLANALTIAVIVTYSTLNQSVFMRFILSLCISDLTSASISWLFLYRRTWGFDVWGIPPFFCKLYWATDLMTSYVTALHILSFSILRWISIRFPVTFPKIKLKHGNIWISLIWAVCFLCGFIPFAVIFGAKNRNRQSTDPDAAWPACTVLPERLDDYVTYQLVGYPLFLLLPAVGVVVFCLLTVVVVREKYNPEVAQQSNMQAKRMRKERQAVVQLVLIIISFLIGYIPFIAYEYWAVHTSSSTMEHRRKDYWFGMVEYFFLRFSECLNPFFYNLGSSKMRNHTATFVKRKLCPCVDWKRKKVTVFRKTRLSASSDGLKTSGTNLGV